MNLSRGKAFGVNYILLAVASVASLMNGYYMHQKVISEQQQ